MLYAGLDLSHQPLDTPPFFIERGSTVRVRRKRGRALYDRFDDVYFDHDLVWTCSAWLFK